MYTFKIYYRVKDSKRRRSRKLNLDCSTLLEAWTKALDCAIVYTREDEVIDSICQEVNN